MYPIIPAFSKASIASSEHEKYEGNINGNDDSTEVNALAGNVQSLGGLLASGRGGIDLSSVASDQLRSNVSGKMSSEAERWLSRFGTAQVSLEVDQNYTLKNSSFEFLLPLYDNREWLIFSQQGIHRDDERTQMNLGVGIRRFGSVWMTGVNTFYDYDITRYHRRAGIGLELWRDYLKLSANNYFRLSQWRSASELNNDYEARPANGWDIQAEGWLPVYPQLGAKVAIEQYYGKEVALFGTNNRQENPHAITVGLNWTPVPVVTISAERSAGAHDMSESRLGLQFNYTPGMSWAQHFDAGAVRARRTLSGSRLDLVERNNNIVLEYRKKDLIKLSLRERVEGKEGQVFSLITGLQSKYPLQGIEWRAGDFLAAGGKITGSGTAIRFTFPAWRPAKNAEEDMHLNSYTVTGVARDNQGNRSEPMSSTLVVQGSGVQIKPDNFTVSSGARANGLDTNTARAIVTDSTGKTVAGKVVTFTLPPEVQVKGGAFAEPSSATGTSTRTTVQVITDKQGMAGLDIVSLKSGTWTISAAIESSAPCTATSTFYQNTSQGPQEILSLELSTPVNNQPADGKSVNMVRVVVKDKDNILQVGEKVNFSVDAGVTPSADTVMTDENGVAQISLSSQSANTYSVTVLAGGSRRTVPVKFSAVVLQGAITANPAHLDIRENKKSIITLRLTDQSGNIIPGKKVIFTVSGVSNTAISDVVDHNDGTYSASLESKIIGNAVVTANVDNSDLGGINAIVKMNAPILEHISVNGLQYALNSGFPKSGFNNAMFKLKIGGGAVESDYNWTTNAPWVSVNNGLVIFERRGDNKKVIITAVPKDGVGPQFAYSFTLAKWFIGSSGQSMTFSEAQTFCQNAGYTVPAASELSGNPNPFYDGKSGVLGALWSEWGNMSTYVGYSGSDEFAGMASHLAMMSWMANPGPGGGMSYYVNLSKGITGFNQSDMQHVQAACVKKL